MLGIGSSYRGFSAPVPRTYNDLNLVLAETQSLSQMSETFVQALNNGLGGWVFNSSVPALYLIPGTNIGYSGFSAETFVEMRPAALSARRTRMSAQASPGRATGAKQPS